MLISISIAVRDLVDRRRHQPAYPEPRSPPSSTLKITLWLLAVTPIRLPCLSSSTMT